MSSDDLPSLPNDVAEILASARMLEGPDGDVRARLRARLVAPPLPPGAAGEGATASPWSRAPWWSVAAALAIGVGAGRLSTAPAPAPATAALPAPVPSVDLVAPPRDIPSVAVSSLVEAPRAPRPSAPPVTAPETLAAERRLLDVARAALGRQGCDEALTACAEHAQRFPRGLLTEEREAIAIKSLAECKRLPEARSRAAIFRQRYPKSILLPAVVAAVEVQP